MNILEYEKKGRVVARLTADDEIEVARSYGMEPDEENLIAGGEVQMQAIFDRIKALRRKKAEASEAEKLAAWREAEDKRTADALAGYSFMPAEQFKSYEYALINAEQLRISPAQYRLLDAEKFTPVSYQKDTYTTLLPFFDMLQALGAIGFRIVSASGLSVFMVKEMYKHEEVKNEDTAGC